MRTKEGKVIGDVNRRRRSDAVGGAIYAFASGRDGGAHGVEREESAGVFRSRFEEGYRFDFRGYHDARGED